jgi:hypothetical protein
MPDRVPALLAQVLGEVLQEAAYVFAVPAEGTARWDAPVFSARIAFESVKGGTLRLTASGSVAREIAANMLGAPRAGIRARGRALMP